MAAEKILRIDPKDNVLVALTQLPAGEAITFAGEQYVPLSEIPAKQKFAMRDLAQGEFKGNAHAKKTDLLKAIEGTLVASSPWNSDLVDRASLLVSASPGGTARLRASQNSPWISA